MAVQKATQDFVPIKEIRDGVVIMDDGSLRAVLMTSALNFALKSEDEQNAIILQYQNFLNSLDFPVQFFIESRKMDIEPYLAMLEDAEKEQPNELLKIQTREYIEFVKNFVKATNIVSKSFYVIVPYNPSAISIGGKEGPFSSIKNILGKGKPGGNEKDVKFSEASVQLQQRIGLVQSGLMRMGVRAVLLNTEELIELYYKLFNPGVLEKEVAQQAAQQFSK